MAKVVQFNTCSECPFSTKHFACWCPVIYPDGFAMIESPDRKDSRCPFPKGILVQGCFNCPHMKQEYNDYYCTNVRDKSLVLIENPKGFLDECKLPNYGDK